MPVEVVNLQVLDVLVSHELEPLPVKRGTSERRNLLRYFPPETVRPDDLFICNDPWICNGQGCRVGMGTGTRRGAGGSASRRISRPPT